MNSSYGHQGYDGHVEISGLSNQVVEVIQVDSPT